jgi:hypothetical protein
LPLGRESGTRISWHSVHTHTTGARFACPNRAIESTGAMRQRASLILGNDTNDTVLPRMCQTEKEREMNERIPGMRSGSV